MNKKLYQENNKNWRQFEIKDDQVVLTGKFEGVERKYTFPFDEVGLVSGSYDKTIVRERSLSNNIVIALISILLAVMLGSIFMVGDKNNPTLVLIGVFNILSAVIGLIIVSVLSQPKNIPVMGVYMGKSSLWFYCRNDEDIKNIDAFLKQLVETQNTFLKKKYLTDNPALSKSQVKDRLSWLYENKVINKEELSKELKKLAKQKQ